MVHTRKKIVEVPFYFCQVLICRQYTITAAILKHASYPILNFHAHHIECDRVSLRETTLKPLAPFLLLSPRLTIPHVKAKIQWYMCPYNLCTQKKSERIFFNFVRARTFYSAKVF